MYGSTSDTTTVPYLKEGKLRILSYEGKEKTPGYEDVPSLDELYGFAIPNLGGIFGPKGLPDDVLKKLDDVFAKAAKDPEYVNFMKSIYTPVVYMDRAQMNKYVKETYAKSGEIMKSLKAEEKTGKK